MGVLLTIIFLLVEKPRAHRALTLKRWKGSPGSGSVVVVTPCNLLAQVGKGLESSSGMAGRLFS